MGIPIAAELRLLESIQCEGISDSETIRALAAGTDCSACYTVVIFAVRMAILSVRQSSHSLFRLALLPILAGSIKVDWRDLLGGLAVLEECASRIGLDFAAALGNVIGGVEDEGVRATIEAYLSRDDAMRSVDAMGLKAVQVGGQLTYAAK